MTVNDINRIWCYSAQRCCNNRFCDMVDVLTDDELNALCASFPNIEYDTEIVNIVSDVEQVADALEIEVEELENRLY